MKRNFAHIIFKFLTIALPVCMLTIMSSCTATKYSTNNGPLYEGYTIEIVTMNEELTAKDRKLKKDIEKIIVPTQVPSTVRQRFYLQLDEKNNKKREGFLKKKIARKPLFYHTITPPEKNVQNIIKLLASKGYFKASVEYTEQIKDDRIKIHYIIKLPLQYRINHISYPADNDPVSHILNAELKNSLLKTGDPYDLVSMSNERKRLVRILKEQGFYKFSESLLLFSVDSSLTNHQLDIQLIFKSGTEEEKKLYRINSVVLRTSYNIPEIDRMMQDTLQTETITFIGDSALFNKRLFEQILLIKRDSLYSHSLNDLSIKRLLSIGIFNSVSINYREKDGSDYLNCYIDCILKQEHSINLDLYLTSKSNNLAGPGLKLEYQYLNALGAAENLKLRLVSGFETQFNNTRKGFETYHFGSDVEFAVPRLLFPIRVKKGTTPKPPQTIFNLGYEILNRRDYYNLKSFYINAGYLLNSRQDRLKLEVYPAIVNYTKPGKISEEFRTILEENPFYARGFQQSFILGSQLNISTALQSKNTGGKLLLLSGLESSGNIMDLLNKKFQLGIEENYSHFSRISLDIRYFQPLNNSSSLALRFFSGVGVPLGNSVSLPYIKQFYAGGPNSIRAFASRSLGPGTYVRPISALDNPYFDQSGDIKLELNAEYRFTIIKYLKGALFTDFGNIWLLKPDNEIPGGQFHLNTFLNQLAIGSGIGLRLDITYFVLRLDIATPLRKPFEEQSWQFNDMYFSDRAWRKDNLIFNLAIGYPF